ncbi:MAG TPA: MFS transporter [Bryobacteraceae bacterium]
MGAPTGVQSPATARASQIGARLDRLPMTRSLWRLVLLISLAGVFEFYDIFLSTYIAPGLVASGIFTNSAAGLFEIDSVGFFIFSTFAGMFAGCMGFGSIADRLGRRTILIGALLWYSTATAMMAFQNTAAGVDLWRFVASIGIGVELVTVDTFIAELVPPYARGKAFAFGQFIEFSVVPVVALLGWLLVPKHPLGLQGWRWLTLIGSAGALLAWQLQRGLPESPRWLTVHEREAEAERVVEDLEARMACDTGRPLPPDSGVSTPRTVAPDRGQGGLREIFRPPHGKRTLVMSVFNLMQAVAFYGFGAWVPTLLIAKGIHVTTSLEYAFIIAIANPLGPLLGMLIADRMERKWQLFSAGVSIGAFIYLFANQSNALLVILFGVMVTLSNNWLSFALHNYQGELFPTRIRGRAVGFVYAWSRASAAFAGLLIGFFLREGGAPAVALFIAAAMLVMVVTIGGFGPRTKGLALEEISK